MAKQKVTDVVKMLAEPIVKEENCVLFDVEYKKEGADYVLRILIEKEKPDEYISINDCENISRKMSDILDEKDPIENQYMLEVSSPGIDRPLRNEADFIKFNGRLIDIGLYKAQNGKKIITGILNGYDGGKITVLEDDKEIIVDKNDASYVKLAIEF